MHSTTLRDIWESSAPLRENLRVRYQGWDHKIKFFKPTMVDRDNLIIEGELDNGEVIRFPIDSHSWSLYDDGMENGAKAV